MSTAQVKNEISHNKFFVSTITECIMSHCLHWHKNTHHEAFLTHGMSIAAILEVWHDKCKHTNLEQLAR